MPKKIKKENNNKVRGMISRYPGDITDWGGRIISSRIRDYVDVGNIVRVPIASLDGEFYQTSYFRIIARCKKNSYLFVGLCEDPYYGTQDWRFVNDGDRRVFSARDISEIPLEWEGNQKLEKKAVYCNKYYGVTGCRF